MNCPGCQIAVNVPVGMASVKCPSCGAIFNPNAPVATPKAEADAEQEAEDAETDAAMGKAAIIAGVVGGTMMLLAMIGLMLIVISREPDPTTVTKVVEDTIKPAVPEEYREIRLPEEHRKRIYTDYRMVARTCCKKHSIAS
jgi:LSD1 subclass zinc finger protein